MKFVFTIRLACVALAVAAVFAGCSQKPAADVLARVGDRDITTADFKAEYERRQAAGLPLPDRQTLLNQMIDRETSLQQAKAAGLDNADDVRRACEDVLIAKYKDTQLEPKVAAVKVSAAEIKAAYEKDLARYTQPAKVKLAIVYIEAGPRSDTNRLAAAELRAQEVLTGAARLPADARGFGQVAADYSDDQITRYRGGDAGWFAADSIAGRWPAEVLAAGFALTNAGDLSGVLHANDGFYVVKKLDSRPSTVTPLEQVRSVIERRLLLAGQQTAESQFKSQARQAAKVSTNTDVLATVFYPTQNQASSKLFNPAALPAAN